MRSCALEKGVSRWRRVRPAKATPTPNVLRMRTTVGNVRSACPPGHLSPNALAGEGTANPAVRVWGQRLTRCVSGAPGEEGAAQGQCGHFPASLAHCQSSNASGSGPCLMLQGEGGGV